MELGGDAHVHVKVQGVVVGDEGPGGGAAGDGVEHRRLHFHIPPAVQEGPQIADELAAHLKVLPAVGVDDQVHIPLAVAQLLVLQAVELLRQGAQGQGHEAGLPGHPGRQRHP